MTTQTNQIKIRDIDTIPETSRLSTDKETNSALWINPCMKTAGVDQRDPGQTGVPSDEWHKRIITANITNENGSHPEAKALEEYLESEHTQTLLARICAGHTIEWDGENRIGMTNADADEALDTLLRQIAALPEVSWNIWSAQDWVYESARSITGTESYEKVREMQADLESMIGDTDIVEGSIYATLISIRDERAPEDAT